jgi:hypothetical protein
MWLAVILTSVVTIGFCLLFEIKSARPCYFMVAAVVAMISAISSVPCLAPMPVPSPVIRQPFGEVVHPWRAPGARERAVDGKPQILQTHPGILPDPKCRHVVARTRAHRYDRILGGGQSAAEVMPNPGAHQLK